MPTEDIVRTAIVAGAVVGVAKAVGLKKKKKKTKERPITKYPKLDVKKI